MARQVTTTRTITRDAKPEGDSLAAQLRDALANVARLTAAGYLTAVVKRVPEAHMIAVHVFKRGKQWGGQYGKVGEFMLTETDAETVESWVFQNWGPGLYQLRLVYGGRYYSPVSIPFRVGETPDDEGMPSASSGASDTDAVIAQVLKRQGHLIVAKDLKRLVGEGEDDMDMTKIAAMMEVQQRPLLAMMAASEARAARAEERAEKLLDRMMADRASTSVVQQPLMAELAKSAVGNPEILALLMGGGANAPVSESWLDLLKGVAQQFGPLVQGMLTQYMQRAGVPVPALPAGEGSAEEYPTEPRPSAAAPPSSGGDQRMPMQLNEEQEMSKVLLIQFIKEGDFANAFATLEAFPGIMPVAGGVMPLGEFIISKIDPAANPKVYVPQLAMLVPEVRGMLPQAEAFVKWTQDKLVADNEAALRERDAHEPRPTSQGG